MKYLVPGFVTTIACLTIALVAQTTVNHRTQVKNEPQFKGGFITSYEPNGVGPKTVHVDQSGNIRVHVIPVINEANQFELKPGPCSYTYQEPMPVRQSAGDMQSAIAVQTPDSMYFCVPDGTGKGFHWLKVAAQTQW